MNNNMQADPAKGDSRSMDIAEGLLMGDELASERQTMSEQFMVDLMGLVTQLGSEVGQLRQELDVMRGTSESGQQEPQTVMPVNPNGDSGQPNGILEELTSKLGMDNATNK